MHDRRSFLARAAALAGAAFLPANLLDPEFKLWEPGKRRVILPARYRRMVLLPYSEQDSEILDVPDYGWICAPALLPFAVEREAVVRCRRELLDGGKPVYRAHAAPDGTGHGIVYWSEDPPWTLGLADRRYAEYYGMAHA